MDKLPVDQYFPSINLGNITLNIAFLSLSQNKTQPPKNNISTTKIQKLFWQNLGNWHYHPGL